MNICLEEACKCAPPDVLNTCGCTLAAGASLISGTPCAVCGAPLMLVHDERHVVTSFSAVLAPGETREICVETTWIFPAERLSLYATPPQSRAFRPERLLLDVPPQSRAQRLLAYVKHVPWAALTTVGVLMRKVTDREARLNWTWPSWRAPRPGPPVEVVNVRVGEAEQFIRGVAALPSEIFTPEVHQSPYLGLQVVLPEQKLTLVVRSVSKKPYELRGSFVGTAIL